MMELMIRGAKDPEVTARKFAAQRADTLLQRHRCLTTGKWTVSSEKGAEESHPPAIQEIDLTLTNEPGERGNTSRRFSTCVFARNGRNAGPTAHPK